MAFAVRDLGVQSYAVRVTWWCYKTDDTLSQVTAEGYFDEGADMVARGDLVQIICKDGVCLRTFTGKAGEIATLLP